MKLKRMKKLLSEVQANKTMVMLLSDNTCYCYKDIVCKQKYAPLKELQITQFDTTPHGQLLITIDDTVLNDYE